MDEKNMADNEELSQNIEEQESSILLVITMSELYNQHINPYC